jgi:hypothetical protein
MSRPPQGLQQSFTLPEIQAWIDTTKQKGDDLHLLAAEPLYNTRRAWAVRELATLLQEAIEEVRVISASLQEDSQALCARATALRHHSDVLLARGRSSVERLPPCAPSPQERPAAEHRVLDRVSENARHAAQP